jgi:hypothetical protein
MYNSLIRCNQNFTYSEIISCGVLFFIAAAIKLLLKAI